MNSYTFLSKDKDPIILSEDGYGHYYNEKERIKKETIKHILKVKNDHWEYLLAFQKRYRESFLGIVYRYKLYGLKFWQLGNPPSEKLM